MQKLMFSHAQAVAVSQQSMYTMAASQQRILLVRASSHTHSLTHSLACAGRRYLPAVNRCMRWLHPNSRHLINFSLHTSRCSSISSSLCLHTRRPSPCPSHSGPQCVLCTKGRMLCARRPSPPLSSRCTRWLHPSSGYCSRAHTHTHTHTHSLACAGRRRVPAVHVRDGCVPAAASGSKPTSGPSASIGARQRPPHALPGEAWMCVWLCVCVGG